jgi:hypothetical protein
MLNLAISLQTSLIEAIIKDQINLTDYFKTKNIKTIAREISLFHLNEQLNLCLEIEGNWTERSIELQQQINEIEKKL